MFVTQGDLSKVSEFPVKSMRKHTTKNRPCGAVFCFQREALVVDDDIARVEAGSSRAYT